MNERIKELRKVLGLTQQEFAENLNIKRGAIANYEIGRNEPIDAVVELICTKYNVNEDWLRTGEGEIFKQIPEENEIAAIVSDLLENNGQTDFYNLILSIMIAYKKLDKKYQDVLNELIQKCYQEMTERKKEED